MNDGMYWFQVFHYCFSHSAYSLAQFLGSWNLAHFVFVGSPETAPAIPPGRIPGVLPQQNV
jgi:hypothetical protein